MIHLVIAEDEFSAEEASTQIAGAMPKGTETVVLECEASDVPGLDEAFFAPSLFASDRLIVVREAQRLNATGVKRLTAAIGSDGLVGTVVVEAVTERAPNALVKALQGRAKLHRLPRPRRGELVGWVVRRMKVAGVTPGPEVSGLLVEAVGSGLRDLDNAIAQLAMRVGAGGIVQQADVLAHFPKLAEQPVWALFDALGAGDGHKAFRVLHALLAQGDGPIGIIGALVSQIRYVMRARSALERSPGINDAALAQALAVSPGRASVLRRQASQHSWEWLLRVHRLCADADFDLKGGDEVRIVGVLPPEIVLERVIDGALPALVVPPGPDS